MIYGSIKKLEENFLDNFGYWILVGSRADLSASGQFIKVKAPQGEIVVFNDFGKLVAFDNHCPHRGAKIYASDKGRKPFVCPYHGWAFKKGEVVVPKGSNYQLNSIPCLSTFEISLCGEFVFVNYNSQLNLNEFLTPEYFIQLAELSKKVSNLNAVFSVSSEACWPAVVENALEALHLPSVHTSTLHTLEMKHCSDTFFGPHNIVELNVMSQRILKSLKFYVNDEKNIKYRSYFIFPFTFVSVTGDLAFSMQHMFPTSSGNTTIYSYQYSSIALDGKATAENYMKGTVEFNKRVFQEDADICNGISFPIWQKSFCDGYLDSTEQKISAFRQSILDELKIGL